MATDNYPRIELKYSITKFAVTLAVLLGVVVYFGLVAHGDIVETGRRAIGPHFAMVLLAIFLGCLLFAAYQITEMGIRKPALVISEEGFLFPRFSSQLIPWPLVKEINVRPLGENPSATFVEILLNDDIPQVLRSEIGRKSWLNFRKDGPVITVVPFALAGMSQTQIIGSLESYYREFGTRPTVA
jgi:hypothetical protein